MSLGLVGYKKGMTRIFDPSGKVIPVTVVEVLPNRITQIKTVEKEGYSAIQVTQGTCKNSKVSKPLAGHFAKAGVLAGKGTWEFRLNPEELETLLQDKKVASELTVSLFQAGQKIDVSGTTKGRGFAGVIKRHNFSSHDASHGNSLSHRVPGSIGQRTTPGRVMKGKKLPGHMGNVRRTIQSLEIVDVDKENNLLLIKGSVPGAPEGVVFVRPAIKQGNKQIKPE
ncbi:MAG: 50S ribosomal protein L3 [Gammaproteobacteria bacterium]|nr:50S ribosomal protein L3 [Gammaproteobacteria bacterium]